VVVRCHDVLLARAELAWHRCIWPEGATGG
jgi:hypothetical protein